MKLKQILIYLCLAVYAYFCYKMLVIAMQYIPYHTDVAFLGIKQDVIGLFCAGKHIFWLITHKLAQPVVHREGLIE